MKFTSKAKFWDPIADSVFAVCNTLDICVEVYCSSYEAQEAAIDRGFNFHVVEIINQELSDFWSQHPHLELIN